MVMIPKLGRDHTKVKGWGPVVLLHTIAKLAEKVVAEGMMKRKDLFHERRKGRGAIDSVMLMDELRKETGGDVYGRDIKSAFNSLDREKMREVLAGHEDLRDWVDYFLRSRAFEIKVDGKGIGRGTMVGGTPQGSPLSPTLFTACMSAVLWEAEREPAQKEDDARHRMVTRGRNLGVDRHKDRFIPLSYIDDINSVRVGKEKPMDEALEKAASKYGLKWDRSKDWKNEVHLGVNLNAKKHWKFWIGRAEAAFNIVRRLSRLLPEEKRKVVIGKLLPILTYGAELHTAPSEESSRLAACMARWVVMEYKESSGRKIGELSGIGQLEELLHRKRVRWAASVYGRGEPELCPRARRTLEEELGSDVEGVSLGKETRTAEAPDDLEKRQGRGEVVGYTDGSRMEGRQQGRQWKGVSF